MERDFTRVATLKFGSFPRSGSHFFTHLTRCEWLSHRIEPLSTESNVVVSIRNPAECIPSWITLTDDHRIDRVQRVLEWYCTYYEQCSRLDIVVLSFRQLISDPLTCINYAHSRYGLEQLDTIDFDLDTGFHYPSPDRSQHESILNEMMMASDMSRAEHIYRHLAKSVG